MSFGHSGADMVPFLPGRTEFDVWVRVEEVSGEVAVQAIPVSEEHNCDEKRSLEREFIQFLKQESNIQFDLLGRETQDFHSSRSGSAIKEFADIASECPM